MSSITERLGALLARTAPFDHMTPAERQDLIGDMTLEIYEPGEVILQSGTDIHRALYIVESGLVRLYDDEHSRLLDMCGEGAVFGSYGLIQGGILPYTAKAVEATVCALLSAKHFEKLSKQDPAFASYFDEDLKRYVRTMDAEIDASGAYLLFDTALNALVTHDALVVSPDATVREVAERMAEAHEDTVVIAQDGAPMGLLTEGDLVRQVVAGGTPATASVMDLVERPPITLDAGEKLFDAVRVMMHNRVRRVVVAGVGETGVGLVTAEDIAHFRGLDPIATIERLEKAHSVEELASIRQASNRRLFRLYQQGVQSEALLDVIAEIDDQLKSRLFQLIERDLAAEHPDAVYEGDWAWLAFGSPARHESALYTFQDNGLVYADPRPEDAERAARWYGLLAERAVTALQRCGYAPAENGILASNEAFRQPLSSWQAAYRQWVEAAEPGATLRALPCFDVRAIYGDEGLQRALRQTIQEAVQASGRRFLAILMRDAAKNRPPISFFGRFELESIEGEMEGLNLRERGLRPIVDLARVLALEAGFLRSTNTFDRLRHVTEATPKVSREAGGLLTAYQSLADMHLRAQMQAAETGDPVSDVLDPNDLHKSQQNLLKETFKRVDKIQSALAERYER